MMATKLTIRTMALLACLLMGLTASAYDFMVDGLCYNYNSDGTSVTVTYEQPMGGYSNLNGALIIPETVTYSGTTYSVTTIGLAAFYGCTGLTSVIIPNSVSTIGEGIFGAFENCSGLESMVVASGNTKYDSRNNCNGIIETATNTLFAGCKATTIPNSVTSIGKRAFSGCTGLTLVAIPNSVTSIGSSAFQNCSSLSSVTIPSSVTSIGFGAFSDCSGLTSVAIGNSVTSIGDGAFSNCTGLESIVVASGNTKYDSRNNCNGIIETATNTLFAGCKATTIPNSVTSIGSRAFQNCSSLSSVTIPSSVTSIGSGAFSGCSGLSSVTIPSSVTSIGDGAFVNCSSMSSVNIGNSVTSIGASAFAYCFGLNEVNISDLSAWCKITFADSVANPLMMAHSLFINGEKVDKIEIPNSVTKIGDYSFYGCKDITELTIPNSVTCIGYYSFCDCKNITELTIANSVNTIRTHAFKACDAICSIKSEISNPTIRNVEGEAFSSAIFSSCTLHVPAETKHMYQVTSPWKYFENIIEGEGKDPCDINGDGVVDIFDVNAVINRMLGVE